MLIRKLAIGWVGIGIVLGGCLYLQGMLLIEMLKGLAVTSAICIPLSLVFVVCFFIKEKRQDRLDRLEDEAWLAERKLQNELAMRLDEQGW